MGCLLCCDNLSVFFGAWHRRRSSMRGGEELQPLWLNRLQSLAKKGQHSVNSWWQNNREKYLRFLALRGVVPALLTVFCLALTFLLTNQWQVVVDGRVVGVVKDRQAVANFLVEMDTANRTIYPEAEPLNEVIIARSYGTRRMGLSAMQSILTTNLEWGIQGATIALDDCDLVCMAAAADAETVIDSLKQKVLKQLDELFPDYALVSIGIQEDLKVVEKPVSIATLVDERAATALLNRSPAPADRGLLSRGGSRSTPSVDTIDVAEEREDGEPLIHVEAIVEIVESKSIPYKTEYVNDSNLYKGEKKTQVKGVNGLEAVTHEITVINGEKVADEITNVERVKEPVNAVIKQGTRTAVVTGSGRFVWPVKGTITSLYGYRWGKLHQGLDIAANSGTPIAAADSGVVSFSGTRGNYGKLVEIDHGNGYVTRYAHCSALLVSKGEKVSRGQIIARVGRTGFATGNHVHFEVIYQGKNKDPLPFLK